MTLGAVAGWHGLPARGLIFGKLQTRAGSPCYARGMAYIVMAVVIKTVNLTKRYGSLVALSNLNLEINEGDCFGFIGPNGAGKSTTIKILATLLQPTWGEARVCDYVVGYQSRQIRPLIGYVPDYFGAYEDMVVQE